MGTTATMTSPSDTPTLLERVCALDRSAELSHQYTALVFFRPPPSQLENGSNASVDVSSSYVAVGHAETSFIDSTLLHCKNEDGEPIFLKDMLTNKSGVTTEVLRLSMDIQNQKDMNQFQLFQKRTTAFEHANHLLSHGVISSKHLDLYPITPFLECNGGNQTDERVVLAHVNRNTAPYLGIDSVGVHLHCYVCRKDEEAGDGVPKKEKPTMIEGVFLAKRAPTKSHHANFWDPTVAGGQPVNLSLVENTVKEAQEEAGVPAEWISETSKLCGTKFSDHTHDPLTITTAKPDGSCLKRSLYYSCDLQVPRDWTPTACDEEVSEFKLYSMEELEEELRFGNSVRPAMRAVLLDFMIRHSALKGEESIEQLKEAMRKERLVLWHETNPQST